MKMIVKKPIAVAIILLFIGLALAPSINANISKASVDSELVEFTTELCGLDGGKHTVSLSKEEAEEVEQLIDSIKVRLDKVETREEAVEVFNEAVVELDKYGLLGGLSVKQAERLVAGRYQNSRVVKLLEKLCGEKPTTQGDYENQFCLIAGKTTYTGTYGLIWWIGVHTIWLLIRIIRDLNPFWLQCLLALSLIPPTVLGMISTLNPFALSHTIGFGAEVFTVMGGNYDVEAEGWIWTQGTNGAWTIDRPFFGRMSETPLFFLPFPFLIIYNMYPGAIGFTGLKISLPIVDSGMTFDCFFLGSSIAVKLSSQEPLD